MSPACPRHEVCFRAPKVSLPMKQMKHWILALDSKLFNPSFLFLLLLKKITSSLWRFYSN